MKYERLTYKSGNAICIKETSANDNKSIWNAIERLAELEDDLESGKMIKLPCKVGDTVFLMAKAKENLYYGDYFTVEKIGFDKLGFYVETERGIFRKGNIFLTKAEAEAKLKELKGEV